MPPTLTSAPSRDRIASAVGATELEASTSREADLPRVLGPVGVSGPILVCVAGIHGNEPSGVLGLSRVLSALAERQGSGLRGTLVGLVGNRPALRARQRFLDEDLNRAWTSDGLEKRWEAASDSSERKEMVELWAELEPILAGPHPVTVLDLHSTSGPGPPFVVLEDTLANRRFGLAFPAPLVLGIEEELVGTLTHFLTERRVVNVGFEAGQHDDPSSVDRAAAAIWVALGASGILEPTDPAVREARRRLAEETSRFPAVVEVRGRHPLQPGDGFRMRPGFESFQAVSGGQVVADDQSGAVTVGSDGLLLMPLYQPQGDDGFFLVRPVQRVWLRLSALARRLRLERALPLLPGVSPVVGARGRFVVDTRTARWLAPELFHLLGFRRSGPPGRYLTMVRRHDG